VKVYLVNSQQVADLRRFYRKYAKSDRIDARVLARLPIVNPEKLHALQLDGSLGISVKGPYMVVMQKACNLPGRDKCAGKGGPHWLCHSIVV
jgi:hypothetical protein